MISLSDGLVWASVRERGRPHPPRSEPPGAVQVSGGESERVLWEDKTRWGEVGRLDQKQGVGREVTVGGCWRRCSGRLGRVEKGIGGLEEAGVVY
jgi:hypothetical protein